MRRILNRVMGLFLKFKYLFSRRKAKPYEFINWLKFLNAGMLNDGNIYCFEYVIKNLPSRNPIIEIGSFCGLSTNLISFYLREFNKSNHLITSDRWIFAEADVPTFLQGSNITQD